MKLQNILKKLALPVFALVVVGMLAACSSPASSSSGGGSSNDTEYTLKYDNLVLGTLSGEEFKSMPNNAGTVSGNDVIISSTFIDGLLEEKSAEYKKNYIAVVFYDGAPVNALTQDDLESSGSKLTENVDYKISNDKKVIVLTETGAQKMMPGSSESDDYRFYYGETKMPISVPANYLDNFILGSKLNSSEYTKDDTNKRIILTDSGYAKVIAYTSNY